MVVGGNIERFEVNGVRAVYLQKDSFLTSIQILTDVGSAAEEPEAFGMAHILEHMFFKGSRRRPGGTAITRAANDIGGKMNAYTSYDHTAYFMTVLNDKFAQGLDILADMYQYPLFPPDEFTKELNPILSEYREREDDPESFLLERTLEKYLGTAYHPIIGTEQTIRGATVERMHAFKGAFYGGRNTMVVVVGGVEAEQVRRALETNLAPGIPVEVPACPTPSYQPHEVSLTKPGIQEAYYFLFYPGLPPRHPDRFKQDMMCYLLGGNDSSLLFERVREELGMSCYGIYSWLMRYDPFSLLGVNCGIAPNELDQLHGEVRGCIDRICQERLPTEMLERARASLRTSIAGKSETSSGMASLISVPILKGETEHPVEQALEAIESITADDILDMAQKTFAQKPMKAVLLPER